MKQAEIDFCKAWCELRRPDGTVCPSAGADLYHGPLSHLVDIETPHNYGRGTSFLDLNPRGADLVASYEAALAMGLPIVADDAPTTAEPEAIPTMACPDCEDGTIGIPIEYGAHGGILRVWPATCPRCKGSGEAPRVPQIDVKFGPSISGVLDSLDGEREELSPEAAEFAETAREVFGKQIDRLVGWVHDPDEMRDILSQPGAVIEARWTGGEDLEIHGSRMTVVTPIDRSGDAELADGHPDGGIWFGTTDDPEPEWPVLTAVRVLHPETQ